MLMYIRLPFTDVIRCLPIYYIVALCDGYNRWMKRGSAKAKLCAAVGNKTCV